MAWIILRTAPRSTLRLADTLNAAGFEAWTPRETRERLTGKRRDLTEFEAAILPQYVFADQEREAELLAMARAPEAGHIAWDAKLRRMVARGIPHFSVFKSDGRPKVLDDRALGAMRRLEAELREQAERRILRRMARILPKGPPPKFTAGQQVVVDGAYEGLTLTVAENNEGKLVKLSHPDWLWPIEISAFKLEAVQLSRSAALAA